MEHNPIIYITNMGTTFGAIDLSLREFNMKMKDVKAPKYLLVFYGKEEKGKPRECAEQIKHIFGPEFNHVDLAEIPDPEDTDSCIHTMQRKIQFLLEEHLIENPVLYVNCTAGTKVMVFALSFATLWLVPNSKEFHIIYQGGQRGKYGRVVSSEKAQVFESELKNMALLSLSLNDFLKKRFSASANYLSLLSYERLNRVEKIIYHGILATYYFSIFNFDKAYEHLENYLRIYDPTARLNAGAFQRPFSSISDTVQVLKNPIEAGIELKSIVDSLRGENFSENLKLAKQKIAEKWQSYVGFICSLVALSLNKLNIGEFTESVMLSYRTAELAVQLSLLNYGISVWNLQDSLNSLPKEISKVVLESLGCSEPGQVEKQIGFNRALSIFLNLRNRSNRSKDAINAQNCFRLAAKLQSNRNFCFMAHGFDYKDKESAESAINDLKDFLVQIKLIPTEEELESEIKRFSILY